MKDDLRISSTEWSKKTKCQINSKERISVNTVLNSRKYQQVGEEEDNYSYLSCTLSLSYQVVQNKMKNVQRMVTKTIKCFFQKRHLNGCDLWPEKNTLKRLTFIKPEWYIGGNHWEYWIRRHYLKFEIDLIVTFESLHIKPLAFMESYLWLKYTQYIEFLPRQGDGSNLLLLSSCGIQDILHLLTVKLWTLK